MRYLKFAMWFLVGLIALAPVLWGLSTSFKPTNKILKYPPELIPAEPTLEHYVQIFQSGILRFFLNSVVISGATVVLCLALGSLAAYALSRFRFAGDSIMLYVILVTMSIPIVALLVPTYTFFAKIGLLNTHLGLIVLYAVYNLPITVWIMKDFFSSIPSEMEKAAMVDGYTRIQAMRKVLLPLSAPGLIAAGLFILTFAWNDFEVALIMTHSNFARTLPVAIYNYLGFFGREWGPLMASSMVAITPIIILFVFFQKYFISGLTSGSTKG